MISVNQIYSIIIGMILGCLIFYYSNITDHGPDSNVFKHKIFMYDNKCYKFVPKIHICPINK